MMDENYTVLVLVPALLDNLFVYRDQLDVVRLLLAGCDINVRNKLETLPSAIWHRSLSMDENKSTMLAFLVGKMFSEAVEIVTTARVLFLVYSNDKSKHDCVYDYLRGDYGTDPVLVKVVPKQTENGTSMGATQHLIQELKEVCGRLGSGKDNVQVRSDMEMVIEQLRQAQHSATATYKNSLHKPTETVSCDMKSWYCSCDEYQHQVAGTSPNHPETLRRDQVPKAIDFSALGAIDKRMEHIFSSSSRVPTKHTTPLPICSHLLSVLIISFNSNVKLYSIE